MNVSKLASAIYNDIVSGLQGFEATQNMSLQQLEDEVVEERLAIIKQLSLKNLLPKKDLMYSINCITVDCESLDKCCINAPGYSPAVAHFEIPQIVNDFGEQSIAYLGAIDKSKSFKIYLNTNFKFHSVKMHGKDRPFVYIDTTPNANNLYDCYVFNAPLIERITIIAIFKDPRQVAEYMSDHGCCDMAEVDNFTWIDTEVKNNLIKKKLAYYRQYYPQPQSNDQIPK